MRYEVVGNWTREAEKEIEAYSDGERVGIVVKESCDLKDTRSEFTYLQGAFRVRVEKLRKGIAKPRAQTFKGESAWSNAERIFRDYCTQLHLVEVTL